MPRRATTATPALPGRLLSTAALLLGAAVHRCEGYTTLQPNETYRLWLAGNFSALVDVRTEAEYTEGHILGAVFAENMASGSSVPEFLLGCEECAVATYCKTGVRAGNAAVLLENNGFTTVYNVLGVEQLLYSPDSPPFPVEEGVPKTPVVTPCHSTAGQCHNATKDDAPPQGGSDVGGSVDVSENAGAPLQTAGVVGLIFSACSLLSAASSP